VENAGLIFHGKTDATDYHSEMNSHVFEKWMKEKVIPNVKDKTCFVLDNASYHNRVDPEDQLPTSSWKKERIREWLDINAIPYPTGAYKPELVSIAKAQHRPKVYAIDKYLASKGHTALRLPPYHADLNQ